MSAPLKAWRSAVDGAGLAGLAVLTGVAYLGAYRPLAARIERRHAIAAQLEQAQTDLAAAGDRLDQTKARLATLAAEHAAAVQVRPLDALNQRMGLLSESAERCGLKVNQMRPGEPHEQGQFAVVPVTLAGECSYSKFSAFLERLQRDMPDLTVESFDLVAQRASTSDAGAVFNVQAVWYARRSDAGPAAGNPPQPAPGT